MVLYMTGTRRIDEMAMNARSLAFQEDYSYTEGWDDNTVGEIFNLGLNKLYRKICEIDQVANIQEYTQDIVAGQQEYDIPQDVKMKIQINNVRYLYGPETWQFVTLEQGMIQDRFSYPTNIPNTYCIRNGKLILSPTPAVGRPQALIVNFQKRMRRLDYRRGKVTNINSNFGTVTNISNANPAQVTTASPLPGSVVTGTKIGLMGDFQPSFLNGQAFVVTVTGANTFTLNGIDTTNSNPFSGTCLWFENPVTFLLNFTVTSQKDTNLQANADSILDKVDWACFVDRNGNSVIDAIAINAYDEMSFILTCDPNYVINYDNWLNFQANLTNQNLIYVVTGDYSSTHSELDRESEDLLIEYCVLRLLRLQSASEPTQDQLLEEERVLRELANAYRRYRPSVVPIVWQRRIRTRSWFMGGRGAY